MFVNRTKKQQRTVFTYLKQTLQPNQTMISYRYRAPAGNLCLKTNLPWVAFDGVTVSGDGVSVKGGAPAPDGGATGGAVGASGTTLLPPVVVIMPGGGEGNVYFVWFNFCFCVLGDNCI